MALVQALAHGVYSKDEAAYRDRIRAYKLSRGWAGGVAGLNFNFNGGD